eukprot:scaffold60603_cov18-Tisochrysis_lutea.AAC.2
MAGSDAIAAGPVSAASCGGRDCCRASASAACCVADATEATFWVYCKAGACQACGVACDVMHATFSGVLQGRSMMGVLQATFLGVLQGRSVPCLWSQEMLMHDGGLNAHGWILGAPAESFWALLSGWYWEAKACQACDVRLNQHPSRWVCCKAAAAAAAACLVISG